MKSLVEEGDGTWLPHTATHIHLHELRCKVSLTSLEQLISEDFRAFGHADHISIKQADVLLSSPEVISERKSRLVQIRPLRNTQVAGDVLLDDKSVNGVMP